MDVSIFTLFLKYLTTTKQIIILCSYLRYEFSITIFRGALVDCPLNGRSKLAVATLKRWSGEPSRLIYDVRMMKNGSAQLRRDRAAARSGSSGGGMKGPRALSYVGAPWFTVDDIFSLALVGAYRTTAPDNGGPAWHFVSNYCPALARPVLSISSVPYRTSTERDNALFYSALFLFCFACLLCFFFRRVIFRQPLALCCAVARRRRVSARISRLSWHRFIIARSGCANRLGVKDTSEQIRRHFKYACLCVLWYEKIDLIKLQDMF